MMQDDIDRLKVENDKLKTENEYLRKRIENIKNSQKVQCASENDMDEDVLLAKLQDQHQQDCIRINDLTTTIHVLAGLYSNLRKNVGMD